MITLDLRDQNLIENFRAIQELQKTGMYSDEEIQILYKDQNKSDGRESNGT